MPRPAGVLWIAILFFLISLYLGGAALLLILVPGAIPLTTGSSFLGGLELAGPYMFLLAASLAVLIGLGLLRTNQWARRAAIVVAVIGVVLLVPNVSSSVVNFRIGALLRDALGVIVRVMIVWYLYQEPVAESFRTDH